MKEKKPCELCNNPATMYCGSDRANLCWDCDSKVHGVNFLVAKHSRNLLCRSCQSPTPWNASGPRLSPIVSVCEECINSRRACDDYGDPTGSRHGEGEGDDSGCDGDRDGGTVDSEGDEEHQVVPSGSFLAAPPPVVTSPSSSEDIRASDSSSMAILGKRSREEPELCSAWGSTSNWKKYRVLIK
ncbi:hypothetical protein NL676_007865 [Syzygium grande]|nr:hypothetical protein NL676_007865 [Syzygium grande]